MDYMFSNVILENIYPILMINIGEVLCVIRSRERH